MEKVRIVTTCINGVGSSMMLSMNVKKHLNPTGMKFDVVCTDMTSVSSEKGDLLIAAADIAKAIGTKVDGHFKHMIVLDNIASKQELGQKLNEVFGLNP